MPPKSRSKTLVITPDSVVMTADRRAALSASNAFLAQIQNLRERQRQENVQSSSDGLERPEEIADNTEAAQSVRHATTRKRRRKKPAIPEKLPEEQRLETVQPSSDGLEQPEETAENTKAVQSLRRAMTRMAPLQAVQPLPYAITPIDPTQIHTAKSGLSRRYDIYALFQKLPERLEKVQSSSGGLKRPKELAENAKAVQPVETHASVTVHSSDGWEQPEELSQIIHDLGIIMEVLGGGRFIVKVLGGQRYTFSLSPASPISEAELTVGARVTLEIATALGARVTLDIATMSVTHVHPTSNEPWFVW